MLRITLRTTTSRLEIAMDAPVDEEIVIEYRPCDYCSNLYHVRTRNQRFCSMSHRVLGFQYNLPNGQALNRNLVKTR